MAAYNQKNLRRSNSGSTSSVGSNNTSVEYLRNADLEDFGELVSSLWTTMKENDKCKKDFWKQGAIPKSYNWKETQNNVQSSFKWYRNPKEDKKPEMGRPSSLLSLDSESVQRDLKKPHGRLSFPFYYVVPENPGQVNILHPGTYLVIPQNTVLQKPLNVINHPNRTEKKDENPKVPFKENQDRNKRGNFRSNFRRGGKRQYRSKTTPEADCKNEKAKEDVSESRKNPSTSKEEVSNDVIIMKNSEHLCDSGGELPDFILASLMDQLPYFDENYLKQEWNTKEAGMSFDLFVKELKERRTNEVYVKVLRDLPKINPMVLSEKIPEIMVSDDAIQDFIEMEKLKAREELLEKLKMHLVDFDEDEINLVYSRFSDTLQMQHEDKILDLFKQELTINREEEKKMEQLQMISAVLPDIDTDFVLTRLNEICGDNAYLNELIVELLENPNYPKAIEFDPISRERLKLWNYYVTNYSVTSYLKKVPDPEQFFSGSSGKDHGIEKDIAVKFLEKRYPDLDSFQLSEAYSDSGESILKTCELLDRNYLPETTIDEGLRCKLLSEAFLQEITFIAHKDEIRKHLKEERERRELEIQLAQEENSFFECIVCYDSSVIPSEAVVCPEGHITCRYCLITYIETSFAEGKHQFLCLSGTCEAEYTMKTLEKFLRPGLFSKITQRRAAEEVDKAEVPGLEKCPSCEFAYVPAPEDKIFTCLNEDCMRVTCRLCKEPNHIPLSCKEVERPQDLQARQKVEEAMTEKLVRSCPKCSKKFIKVDGCNKITCPCGTLMCYVCSEIVSDYSHFNGMGGSDFFKCPLYSDNKKLHVVDVLEAGVKEMERIKKENPDINFVHDPTELGNNDKI